MFEQDIRDWINGYLAEKLPEHNNIPRCPYAKKSLLANTVWFETKNNQDEVLILVDWYSNNWDDEKHEAVVIHLDWIITDNERVNLTDLCYNLYGLDNDLIFIEECRVLNGTTYNMILIHRFSEMQHAKRTLKRKGYYQDND